MRNIFRCLIFFFLIITITSLIFAGVYYVDATDGNDSNNGLSETNAWQTISKVNKTSFLPGDIIKFKKGEVWREMLIIPSSGSSGNPITFTNYGSGDNPLILGSDDYDSAGSWASIGGNKWATSNSSFPSTPRALWFDTNSTPQFGVEDETPDTNWEWYYDGTNDRVVLYHSAGNPANQTNGLEIGDPSHAYGIYNDGKDYITIDGIDTRFTKNQGIAFLSTGCTNPIIQNCTVTYAAYYGLMVDTPIGTFLIDNCTVSHNGVGEGIYVRSATAGTISKCDISYIWKQGININECDGVTVEYCTIDMGEDVLNSHLGSCIGGDDNNNCIIQNNDLRNAYYSGVDLSAGGFEGGTCSGNIVRYNKCYDHNGAAITINAYSSMSAVAENNEVYYNICYNSTLGIKVVGDSNSNKIYNNIFYANTSCNTLLGLSSGSASPKNNIFKNNICYSTTYGIKHIYISGFTSTNNTFDYNCYYNDHTSSFIWNGSAYNTFAAYQSASSQDSNSLGNNDPLLVNPSFDFRLQYGSFCIDSGTNLGLNRDYYGNAVPYGWEADIGAHEYIGDISLYTEINAVPTSGYAPLSVDFTASVRGGTSPYIYSWNFGDGDSSSSQNPSHTYSNAGTYTATLTVTDSNSNQASDSVIITVSSISLSVSASASPTSGQVPLGVNFTGRASGGTSPYTYSWNFGDGDSSSSQNPSHTYSNAGTYTATLTVTDSNSNQASDSLTITASSNSTFNLSISSATGSPAPGKGGTTDPAPGNHSYSSGSSVQVNAKSNANYRFSKWTGDINDSGRYTEETTITMDKDKSISAHFCTKCGDVNGDLSISPADAQAAFDIFLGRTSNPTDSEKENADVNCDGPKTAPNITPADAQAIFNKYIGISELPCDCSGVSRKGSVSMQSIVTSSINLIIDDTQVNTSGEIIVYINIANPLNIKAFGFDLLFPSEALEFVGIERTELTKDFNQVDANKLAEGVLRVGGYRSKPIMGQPPQILITLIFKVVEEAKNSPSFTIINTVDDIENAFVKKLIALHELKNQGMSLK